MYPRKKKKTRKLFRRFKKLGKGRDALLIKLSLYNPFSIRLTPTNKNGDITYTPPLYGDYTIHTHGNKRFHFCFERLQAVVGRRQYYFVGFFLATWTKQNRQTVPNRQRLTHAAFRTSVSNRRSNSPASFTLNSLSPCCKSSNVTCAARSTSLGSGTGNDSFIGSLHSVMYVRTMKCNSVIELSA